MDRLSVIVMQPTSLCNLNCKYCYIPESARQNSLKMRDEVLEASIRTLFASENLNENILINWHAGEPLTAGIPFYEKACQLIQQYSPPGINVMQAIQTNGVLLNDRWCDFLKGSGIGISVSIDGPEHIHNAKRQTWQGKDSFPLVMRGIKKLKEHKISFYALMVVTEACLDYPDEVYNFFAEQGIPAFGFNVEEVASGHGSSSLNNHLEYRYRNFIERLSTLWVNQDPPLGIREFERSSRDILCHLQGGGDAVKSQIESSTGILTIKRDGAVVPFSPEMASGTAENSDHFVIGNVLELEALSDVFRNPKFTQMNLAVKKGKALCQSTCKYYGMCGGGCPGNKYFEHGSFEVSETAFCRHYYQEIIDVLLNHFQK